MRRTARITGLAMLLTTLACGDDDGISPGPSHVGRYVLRTINGDPLPAFVTENVVARVEFRGGAVRLNADSTYTDSTHVTFTERTGVREVTDVSRGTYFVRGDSVFFDSTRGELYHMVFLHQTSLRQDLAGSVLIYSR